MKCNNSSSTLATAGSKPAAVVASGHSQLRPTGSYTPSPLSAGSVSGTVCGPSLVPVVIQQPPQVMVPVASTDTTTGGDVDSKDGSSSSSVQQSAATVAVAVDSVQVELVSARADGKV